MAMAKNSKYTTFYVVESKVPLSNSRNFKTAIDANTPIETDFINDSQEECRAWILKHYKQDSHIDRDVITIVDERTAKDGSILIQTYE